jgi:hypothetical protein
MPKLTLRDLFAVVTIVALALGWVVDRSRLSKSLTTSLVRQRALAEEGESHRKQKEYLITTLERAGYGVRFDSSGRKMVVLVPQK